MLDKRIGIAPTPSPAPTKPKAADPPVAKARLPERRRSDADARRDPLGLLPHVRKVSLFTRFVDLSESTRPVWDVTLSSTGELIEAAVEEGERQKKPDIAEVILLLDVWVSGGAFTNGWQVLISGRPFGATLRRPIIATGAGIARFPLPFPAEIR